MGAAMTEYEGVGFYDPDRGRDEMVMSSSGELVNQWGNDEGLGYLFNPEDSRNYLNEKERPHYNTREMVCMVYDGLSILVDDFHEYHLTYDMMTNEGHIQEAIYFFVGNIETFSHTLIMRDMDNSIVCEHSMEGGYNLLINGDYVALNSDAGTLHHIIRYYYATGEYAYGLASHNDNDELEHQDNSLFARIATWLQG